MLSKNRVKGGEMIIYSKNRIKQMFYQVIDFLSSKLHIVLPIIIGIVCIFDLLPKGANRYKIYCIENRRPIYKRNKIDVLRYVVNKKYKSIFVEPLFTLFCFNIYINKKITNNKGFKFEMFDEKTGKIKSHIFIDTVDIYCRESNVNLMQSNIKIRIKNIAKYWCSYGEENHHLLSNNILLDDDLDEINHSIFIFFMSNVTTCKKLCQEANDIQDEYRIITEFIYSSVIPRVKSLLGKTYSKYGLEFNIDEESMSLGFRNFYRNQLNCLSKLSFVLDKHV